MNRWNALSRAGATCIQLREKELDDKAFLAEALELKALCHSYQVPLIINDNVTVALQCGADGIHVGQQTGPPATCAVWLAAR